MLYVNAHFSIKDHLIGATGAIVHGIKLGSVSGRHKTIIEVPQQHHEDRLKGFYYHLSLDPDAPAGAFRIINHTDSSMHLILSPRPQSSALREQGGECRILAPLDQSQKSLAISNGRNPVCSWYDSLIKANPGDMFAVARRSYQSCQDNSLWFYMVGTDRVVSVPQGEADERYGNLLQRLDQQRSVLRNGLFRAQWQDVATGGIIPDIDVFASHYDPRRPLITFLP